jgi:hypothetical protein
MGPPDGVLLDMHNVSMHNASCIGSGGAETRDGGRCLQMGT